MQSEGAVHELWQRILCPFSQEAVDKAEGLPDWFAFPFDRVRLSFDLTSARTTELRRVRQYLGDTAEVNSAQIAHVLRHPAVYHPNTAYALELENSANWLLIARLDRAISRAEIEDDPLSSLERIRE